MGVSRKGWANKHWASKETIFIGTERRKTSPRMHVSVNEVYLLACVLEYFSMLVATLNHALMSKAWMHSHMHEGEWGEMIVLFPLIRNLRGWKQAFYYRKKGSCDSRDDQHKGEWWWLGTLSVSWFLWLQQTKSYWANGMVLMASAKLDNLVHGNGFYWMLYKSPFHVDIRTSC